MKSRPKLKYLALGAAACLAVPIGQVPPAAGDPLSWPNGPWVVPQQEESLAAIRDYPQLVATLENIVQSSQGAALLQFAPFLAKGSNRPVPYVTIGTGPRKMIVIAQQHGNEFITSNGMVSLIRALSSNAKEAKFIREELTLYIVPRVNIDGFDATPVGEPWRYNVDPNVCPPAPAPCPIAFYSRGRGYDINRYHSYLVSDPLDDPNTGPVGVGQGDNPVPEALNVRALYEAAGGAAAVEIVIDLHGQATPLDANRDMVTVSTLWPTATPTADALGIRPQFDAAALLSKRVVATALAAYDKIAHATPSRYVGGQEPGISRNAYGLLGSASILMEHRGVGQKAAGYMADISFRAVLAVVEALADGSLYTTDTVRAEALQVAPDSASLFWKCVVARPYTLDNYNFCREKYGMEPRDTLPDFPFEPGAPGPGEALDEETASQIIYELDTE